MVDPRRNKQDQPVNHPDKVQKTGSQHTRPAPQRTEQGLQPRLSSAQYVERERRKPGGKPAKHHQKRGMHEQVERHAKLMKLNHQPFQKNPRGKHHKQRHHEDAGPRPKQAPPNPKMRCAWLVHVGRFYGVHERLGTSYWMVRWRGSSPASFMPLRFRSSAQRTDLVMSAFMRSAHSFLKPFMISVSIRGKSFSISSQPLKFSASVRPKIPSSLYPHCSPLKRSRAMASSAGSGTMFTASRDRLTLSSRILMEMVTTTSENGPPSPAKSDT